MDYLASLIDSGIASITEVKQLVEKSIIAGAENWQSRIDCARVIRDSQKLDPRSLDGQDVLSYIPIAARSTAPAATWARTDRALAVARDLAEKSRAELSGLQARKHLSSPRALQPCTSPKPRKAAHTSHYWASEPEHRIVLRRDQRIQSERVAQDTKAVKSGERTGHFKPVSHRPSAPSDHGPGCAPNSWQPLATVPALSPYFHETDSSKQSKSPRRPMPGIVSSVPFPTLDAPCFGLVQETLAHEPFWLLIAVTFLIKTRGKVAIPVFEKVRHRFPTPAHIADPANGGELLDMIRHLGLAKNRLVFMQKYANGFLRSPPMAGQRHRVPGYDHRDTVPSRHTLEVSAASESGMTALPEDHADAWEIGHLTKGKYALDSWRIFCRDELLHRAEDWNGGGREGEFQPEWMRVRPDDKELRACLRWMWMREGWEWDPRSGEKILLRDEMRRAVNEGRVEYDDAGELRILGVPD